MKPRPKQRHMACLGPPAVLYIAMANARNSRLYAVKEPGNSVGASERMRPHTKLKNSSTHVYMY